ncbi:MAG: indolepyruvate oxidoreductase subunit beta [Bacillota bacterium]
MALEVIISGVGGQGTIIMSHILAEAVIEAGLNVRVGETFGAAMRGGAVMSHVRIGDVKSPLVPSGKADVIAALEPLEALRVGWRWAKGDTEVLCNTGRIYPMDVNIGAARYPEMNEIEDSLRSLGASVFCIDAVTLAEEAGNPRTANVVILGALSVLGHLPVTSETLLGAVKSRVPAKALEANVMAFQLGVKAAQERGGWER